MESQIINISEWMEYPYCLCLLVISVRAANTGKLTHLIANSIIYRLIVTDNLKAIKT